MPSRELLEGQDSGRLVVSRVPRLRGCGPRMRGCGKKGGKGTRQRLQSSRGPVVGWAGRGRGAPVVHPSTHDVWSRACTITCSACGAVGTWPLGARGASAGAERRQRTTGEDDARGRRARTAKTWTKRRTRRSRGAGGSVVLAVNRGTADADVAAQCIRTGGASAGAERRKRTTARTRKRTQKRARKPRTKTQA